MQRIQKGVEVTIAENMKRIKEDPSHIDRLLYPGRQLADFDFTKLKMVVMPCGFPSLDASKVFKSDRGELIIIGARPSQGKSGFGCQIAMEVAKWGKSHIFSLEMGHESLLSRQTAITMNRPLDYIQSGSAKPEELQFAKETLQSINCVIDDRSNLNIHQICDAARMQNKKDKTNLIVVDYIQIVATSNTAGRNIEVGEITFKLKELAKELNIPVIGLSQLNRNSESREDGMPQMSDLKESGQIEQDADVVLLIHRSKDVPTSAKILIAKNRNGPTGEITMEFAPAQCRFIDPQLSSLD